MLIGRPKQLMSCRESGRFMDNPMKGKNKVISFVETLLFLLLGGFLYYRTQNKAWRRRFVFVPISYCEGYKDEKIPGCKQHCIDLAGSGFSSAGASLAGAARKNYHDFPGRRGSG